MNGVGSPNHGSSKYIAPATRPVLSGVPTSANTPTGQRSRPRLRVSTWMAPANSRNPSITCITIVLKSSLFTRFASFSTGFTSKRASPTSASDATSPSTISPMAVGIFKKRRLT